eukprot:6932272-Pyramimonas_sp.AAC.1
MREYATASATRAAVVKGGDPLAEADIPANPAKAFEALYTGLKTWFDKECFKIQGVSRASSIMTL